MIKTKTLFRWHFWLGLTTGLFMLVIGGSGAVAVFIEEIDWLVTPALRVSPAADSPRADVDQMLATVRAAYPAGRVTTINLSERPSFAHVIRVSGEGRGTREVFLHPSTGEIQGYRIVTGDYTSTLRNFIRQLHLRLFMGLWGRVFVGVFGVTLVLSCITGLWIYRGWFKNLCRLRWRGAAPRSRWSDLHKLIGIWSLLFNLVIGATGAVFGLENLAGQIRSHWFKPAPAEKRAAPTPRKSATPDRTIAPLPLETLLAKAHAAFPDLAVRSIFLPPNPSASITLRGDVPSWSVQQSHVRRANFISLDPQTGAILRRVDGREAKGWDRLYSSFDPLHFGYFGGMTTKIIWFVLGLAPSVLSLTGVWLWWLRSRRHTTPTATSPSPKPSSAARWILAGFSILTLALSYAIVALNRENWALTGKLFEHAVTKPVTLAVVAFPVTGLLVWLSLRCAQRPGRLAIVLTFAAGWFLLLVQAFL